MVKPLKNRVKRRRGVAAFPIQWVGGFKKTLIHSLPYVLLLALIGVLFGGAAAYALNSPAFRLEEVRVLNIGTLTSVQAFDFCELRKGENLVSLDLVNIQEVIKRKHPEFKEVKVRRVLPNRIEVILKRRTPIAQMTFSRFVQVDKDLVVLPGSSAVAFRNLTVLAGVPPPREGLFVGVTVSDPSARKALKLAELVKRSNVLRRHSLTRVDVHDPKNVSLFVDGDIEIRMGESHFVERLKILDQTLRTVELDGSRVRYIDLRFDDVVVGPRQA